MGKIMILNGSPRAPRSNSKCYAELFSKKYGRNVSYFAVSKNNHCELCAKMEAVSDILLVFPLYVDGIPVTLLNFLKTLETYPLKNRPTFSVLINCGFLEYQKNDIAVEMIKLFCKQNRYPFGAVLKIGAGEAILNTPFKLLVTRKIKKFAASIVSKKYRTFQVTMPISAKMFLQASTGYWTNYGRKNGVTKEQMETMQIEGLSSPSESRSGN